jgi:hypothetical protein
VWVVICWRQDGTHPRSWSWMRCERGPALIKAPLGS